MTWRRRAGIAAFAVVATAVVALLAVNFAPGEKRIEHRLTHDYALEDPQFAQELGVLLGPPLRPGNRVRALYDGDEIFPPMLAAIRGARRSIDFETYIYWSGDIGRAFADALSERARAGVKVNVLLDWVGSLKIDPKLLDEMKAANVRIFRYHPPRPLQLGRLNNRTHRKLLVVDGRTGFTGGVGIAPEWTGHAQDPDHWRDTHFEVEGPVVGQMQAVFADNWIKVSGEVLHGPNFFPLLEGRGGPGGSPAQMFSSSPTGGSESMALMYQLAIAAATRSIDLSASYFVPDALTRRTLVTALRRGVKVRVVVPGPHIDSETVRAASRAGWGELLQAGAVIAEYQPTMFHCKVMIVDDLLVSVGSTNFDERSFRLNDEATLNVLDADFARAQRRVFEADLAKSKVITYAAWRERPLRERMEERLAEVLHRQL